MIKIKADANTKPISRQEAIEYNLKHYFTGIECLEGHLDFRYTSSTDCVVCHRLRTRLKGRENIRKIVEKNRIKTYGINDIEFKSMLKSQNYKCALCDKLFDVERNIHLDHNHKTGKVRAILCHHCNTGLGLFKDSIELLQKAISYLKWHDNGMEKSS